MWKIKEDLNRLQFYPFIHASTASFASLSVTSPLPSLVTRVPSGLNSTDSILLIQSVGEIRVELDSKPVSMRLLHVGEHRLWVLVTGHKYDLDIVHSLIECLELGSEGLARGAPGGREVEQD